MRKWPLWPIILPKHIDGKRQCIRQDGGGMALDPMERGTKMKSIKRLAAAVLAFVMLFTAAVGMTTAAAEGAAIPGAAAKTAPTLDEALKHCGRHTAF